MGICRGNDAGAHLSSGPKGTGHGREHWGYAGVILRGRIKVGVLRRLSWEWALGISRGNSEGAHKSRGPEKTGHGRRHWGYAGVILQEVYAGGGVSEEVRRR